MPSGIHFIDNARGVRRVFTRQRTPIHQIDVRWLVAGTGTSWFSADHGIFGWPIQDFGGLMFSMQPIVSQFTERWKVYPPIDPPADPQFGYLNVIFEWVDSAGTVINEAGRLGYATISNTGAGCHALPITAPERPPAGLKQRIDADEGNVDGTRVTGTAGLTQATIWLWQ